ncbi:aminoacetone oxidase family FAD-binding enzyme [Eubacteriales bacterium KG127]
MKIHDGIIIGAGAAGMAAAIAAKQTNPRCKIAVLEKMDRPGLKVAATGNGRCNITNTNCPDYKGTVQFFQSIGIMTRDDGKGWIYPYNEEAKSVVLALKSQMKKAGVELCCNTKVNSVTLWYPNESEKNEVLEKASEYGETSNETKTRNEVQRIKSQTPLTSNTGFYEDFDETKNRDTENGHFSHIFQSGFGIGGLELLGEETSRSFNEMMENSSKPAEEEHLFKIKTDDGEEYFARKILISTGGKSGPKLGTTGDGYIMVRNLGHNVSTLVPCLTTIETYEETKYLAGVRAKATATLYFEGLPVVAEDGEVQFTEKGISGICIFNLSRYMTELPLDSYTVKLDFLPDIWNVEELLIDRKNLIGEGNVLLTMLKSPLRKVIEAEAEGDMHEMARLLKEFTLSVKNLGGWKQAQVTRGGVDLAEVDQETMESLVIKNLYIAGEVLDYDGPCGGFNLNHAWQTGVKAGRAMGK